MSIKLVQLRDTRTGIVSETGLDGTSLDRFLRENPDIVRAGLNTTADYQHYFLLNQNNVEFADPKTADLVYNPFSKRLGIGSFIPQSTLDVAGDIKFNGNFTNAGISTFNGPAFFNSDVTLERFIVGVATITKKLDVGLGGTVFTVIASTDPNIVGAASTRGGNVGIGSTIPQQKLDVAGSIKINQNIFDSVNVAGTTGYYLSRDLNGIRWVNVSPTEAQGIFVYNDLQLIGAGQSFFGINLIAGNGLGVSTDPIQASVNSSNSSIADIKIFDNWAPLPGGDIYRYSNIGINNNSPAYTLDVTGTTRISESLTVQGAATVGVTLGVTGATTISNTLGVTGATNISNTLGVTGQTNLTNTTQSTTKDTGALIVDGGVGIEKNLHVGGIVSTTSYFGAGDSIVGIVTQIIPSIGINITSTQQSGKGVVTIDAYKPTGKTIFVNQNGNDNNTGLSDNHAKKTIKSAASISLFGDTIKVYPGTYIEDNPIVLNPTVSVEGTELRNCVVTPKNPGKDLFVVNNGCHITDMSFVGQESQNGASIVTLQPLTGVNTDRYFDAARLIRNNLKFISAETVGYLTSTDYKNPPFTLNTNNYTSCRDDIEKVFKAVIFDITRGGNSRCVGAGVSYYTSNNSLQHIVGVKTETIDAFKYAVGIAVSCLNNVLWTGNYQSKELQLRDLSIQSDPATGSNKNKDSCANVRTSISNCVGVVTTIIDVGPSVAGITTTFPGNSGIGFTTLNAVSNAIFDESSGKITLTVPNYPTKVGDMVEIRNLQFSCLSNGSPVIQKFPSGKFGNEFYIEKINTNGTFDVYVGISSIVHTYVAGSGFLVNRSLAVQNATYDKATGITTITAPGAYVRTGDVITVRDLLFSCPTVGGGTTTFPRENKEGLFFKVNQVIGIGKTFSINVGTSTLPHTYVSGGLVFPAYSRGVGPILQGPYVRNCTNFIPKSIGMQVDGFAAEPGDQDDIGVTGSMSVDSYTQFNESGVGVSITNGGYCQLVSIFTICSETGIICLSGGQCDITNSNSSFGTFGLVSVGVGNSNSKSIYRYTGNVVTESQQEQGVISVGGLGTYRPYDGLAIYFGELYYTVQKYKVTNGGSGYVKTPNVTISAPTGPNGIRAEAVATVENGSVVEISVISSGNQYQTYSPAQVQIDAIDFQGSGATAQAIMAPIYYTLESATLPSAGVSTITLNTNLNNTVSVGTTVYFSRLSLQITSSHSFQWVGSGNNILSAKPALGGVVSTENEIVKTDGGEIIYTSTDQAGNFRIGDGVVINQLTGTITGRSYSQSILSTVTPLIVALG